MTPRISAAMEALNVANETAQNAPNAAVKRIGFPSPFAGAIAAPLFEGSMP
ncbi:hypothetical protein [Bradyrhizobium sp. WSM3983]|uniref:hypothetical protein n=1 Tax=Bradyrhizobium sp. WSM3983 TaxID=1038867 RepID=UPI001FD8D35E|nr:hypothetical protein [Bradyrhizobium sp. WSM3983]